jgi:hypothetical protein
MSNATKQKGWSTKATEHYEKFVSLRKDADSEVENARKRLAGLKSK